MHVPDRLEANGGVNMSPVAEVLSMKSSSRFEKRLRNVSSREESPALAELPSPVLPGNQRKTIRLWTTTSNALSLYKQLSRIGQNFPMRFLNNFVISKFQFQTVWMRFSNGYPKE